jgi:hypothetical protein
MKFVAFALAFAVLDYFYVFFYIMNDHSLLLASKATGPLAPRVSRHSVLVIRSNWTDGAIVEKQCHYTGSRASRHQGRLEYASPHL